MVWKVVSRERVFSVRERIHVDREAVELPDGRIIDDYYTIELPDFVEIFSLDAHGRTLFLRQYKHGARSVHLCLPAGHVEAGESPLDAAKREFLEETGHVAEDWTLLGSFCLAGNQGCGRGHAFLCRAPRKVAEARSGDLEDAAVELLSRADIRSALTGGEIVEAGDLSTLALALAALG